MVKASKQGREHHRYSNVGYKWKTIILLCKYWAFSLIRILKVRCAWSNKSTLLQVLPYLQLPTSWTPSFSPPHPVPLSHAVFIHATHLHYRNLLLLNCVHTEKAQIYTSLNHWLLRQKGWDPAALRPSCQQLNQKDSRPEIWNFTGTPPRSPPLCFQQGAAFESLWFAGLLVGTKDCFTQEPCWCVGMKEKTKAARAAASNC